MLHPLIMSLKKSQRRSQIMTLTLFTVLAVNSSWSLFFSDKAHRQTANFSSTSVDKPEAPTPDDKPDGQSEKDKSDKTLPIQDPMGDLEKIRSSVSPKASLSRVGNKLVEVQEDEDSYKSIELRELGINSAAERTKLQKKMKKQCSDGSCGVFFRGSKVYSRSVRNFSVLQRAIEDVRAPEAPRNNSPDRSENWRPSSLSIATADRGNETRRSSGRRPKASDLKEIENTIFNGCKDAECLANGRDMYIQELEDAGARESTIRRKLRSVDRKLMRKLDRMAKSKSADTREEALDIIETLKDSEHASSSLDRHLRSVERKVEGKNRTQEQKERKRERTARIKEEKAEFKSKLSDAKTDAEKQSALKELRSRNSYDDYLEIVKSALNPQQHNKLLGIGGMQSMIPHGMNPGMNCNQMGCFPNPAHQNSIFTNNRCMNGGFGSSMIGVSPMTVGSPMGCGPQMAMSPMGQGLMPQSMMMSPGFGRPPFMGQSPFIGRSPIISGRPPMLAGGIMPFRHSLMHRPMTPFPTYGTSIVRPHSGFNFNFGLHAGLNLSIGSGYNNYNRPPVALPHARGSRF